MLRSIKFVPAERDVFMRCNCSKFLLTISLFCFFLPCSANDGSNEGANKSANADALSISGSNTLGAKLIPSCAKSYLAHKGGDQPRINITSTNEFNVSAPNLADEFDIKAHGSSTGFKSLLAGEASIAMSSRAIKAKEVTALSSTGDMLSAAAEHTVALDGLAILVHQNNPVNELSTKQIAEVFSGKITNWSAVGGEDRPISLYARDENSGTWDTFNNLVLGKQYQLRSDASRFESNDNLSDQVATDLGGIGFAGLASVRSAKLLAVSDEETPAVLPTRLSVATEDYPLTRRLFLYTPLSLKDDQVDQFVEFCQSSLGQKVVAEVGFVSQNIIAVEQEVVPNAPSRYQELAGFADRLSVNFRFKPGSSQLDNKAVRDVQRLVDFLRQPENVGRPIYLVGFSDQGKTDQSTQLLSRFRALSVWSALYKEGVLVYESMGFGAFMPVASNLNKVSKLKNGRVEVWVASATQSKIAGL